MPEISEDTSRDTIRDTSRDTSRDTFRNISKSGTVETFKVTRERRGSIFGNWPKYKTPLQQLLKDFAAERNKTNTLSGQAVKDMLKFTSLLDILPRTSNAALIGAEVTTETRPLSHFRLIEFISNEFNLIQFGLKSKDRVAVCLPQGPELVVCLLATVTYCAAVPINPSSTQDEIQFEMQNIGVKAVIYLETDSAHIKQAALNLGITSIFLRPISDSGFAPLPNSSSDSPLVKKPPRTFETFSRFLLSRSLNIPAPSSGSSLIKKECGLFTLHQGPVAANLKTKTIKAPRKKSLSMMLTSAPPRPSFIRISERKSLSQSHIHTKKNQLRALKPTDVAIILHTSGTTGTKKIVPILLEDLIVGAFCVAASMELTSNDICCNMMPLFHVGGIVRNVFAPLLAGGSLICMPSVDPYMFWDLCGLHNCTWYYAAPTIHMMLIEEAKRRKAEKIRLRHRIRIIANAAGGLLPSIAEELRNTFGANSIILPSYGMTECMPISCPPSGYKLERAGTSGLPVGPEVGIRGDGGEKMPAGEIGRIVLRGTPLMRGYENNPKANKDAFDAEGWFDTGDMGYLDKDGYLYLTGRSKEVINRGGEIISPFDIEDVVTTHPSVQATVAFSVPHDKLQETIGVVIVTKPGFPRVSLKNLHRFVSDKLQPAKWPQLVVYMDNLVKTHTNKVQRIGLAGRMNLQTISDATPETERMLEGTCPPTGSSLQVPIPTKHVEINCDEITTEILKFEKVTQCAVKLHKNKVIAYVVTEENQAADKFSEEVLDHLQKEGVHDYLRPAAVVVLKPNEVQLTSDGAIDTTALPDPNLQQGTSLPQSANEKIVHEMFCSLLGEENIGINVDFFECGGDSLRAGQLVSQMRKQFGINLPTTCVFIYRTVEKLAAHIDQLVDKRDNAPAISQYELDEANQDAPLLSYERIAPKSQTRFAALATQAAPLALGYPLRRVVSWFVFLQFFAFFNHMLQDAGMRSLERLVALIISLAVTKLTMWIVLPIVFIGIKWTIIGKYKAGRFPLWGQYYLRWWFVDQCRKLTGRGIFKHFGWSMNLYYRMLGAKIGKNVSIDKFCPIAEYDLIEIGRDCMIESKVLMRPFTSESGVMLLQSIKIGNGCRLHYKASLAPGCSVPNGTIFPPMASSYELQQLAAKRQQLEDLYSTIPEPHWLKTALVGKPILALIKFISLLPVLAILSAMANATWHSALVNRWDLVIEWFLVPQRILIYLALRPIYKVVVPVLRLACCIAAKWIVVGRFREGNSYQYRFKYWFVKQMFGDTNFFGVPGLIGTHYEGVSWIYRLLGAKIGKRIYWPGSGVDVLEYDLFEVGDDVVFGSRSAVKCSNENEMKRVKLKKGSNVADRCFISPGVTVGKGAVLGSGTLAAEDFYFPPKSVWVGSGAGEANCLDRGEEIKSKKIETFPSPFGAAFYMGQAEYFVFPIPLIAAINIVWQSLVMSFFAFPIVASLLLVNLVYPNWRQSMLLFFFTFLGIYICVNLVTSLVALLTDIAAKWILLGRRKQGEYSWNRSSYCQRWQLYLTVQRITHSGYFGNGILEWLLGSAYLVWYFRALGCKIGRNVCLYPTGGDPMMTEPDLVTIGNNVAINNSSVVGHINSRGQFKLNNITLKEGVTLRSYSRLLSGARMEVGAKLLEHTLIMGGDHVSANSVWQGWPASFLYNLPAYSDPKDEVVIEVKGDQELQDWEAQKNSPRFSIEEDGELPDWSSQKIPQPAFSIEEAD
eukprot:Phypoly_transcript_00199.p1 GENE.Phypoly_transcript_00199~~Phypoly_transcript_00199.p1  ORF type:complete len:1729 (+),score=274.19 Phypoly_transcript_00199:185-5371(+)